jgi:hypothetical protein
MRAGRRAVGKLTGGVASDVLVTIAFLIMAALPIACIREPENYSSREE